MPTSEDDWAAWLSEAHAIVQQWEASISGRMLSVTEAATLADRIARGMRQAYERGLARQSE
jgi:hypothetical protein